MNKVVGYVLVAVGILIAAVSKVSSLQSKLSFIPKTILANLTTYGLYVAVGLIAVGVIFMLLSSRNSASPVEVPIYEGKRIIGYRRS